MQQSAKSHHYRGWPECNASKFCLNSTDYVKKSRKRHTPSKFVLTDERKRIGVSSLAKWINIIAKPYFLIFVFITLVFIATLWSVSHIFTHSRFIRKCLCKVTETSAWNPYDHWRNIELIVLLKSYFYKSNFTFQRREIFHFNAYGVSFIEQESANENISWPNKGSLTWVTVRAISRRSDMCVSKRNKSSAISGYKELT